MKVVVGSTNPVKIAAVAEAFKQYWADTMVEGVEVASGVPEQPWGETQTRQGATNRAQRALAGVDFGVGLEGGVVEIEGKLFECAWVAVVDQQGKCGMGGGLYFELPPKVATKVRAGGELGPVMDELTGENNVKQKMGAIGVLTRGKLDRKGAYVQLVLSALIKFVNPEWYS